MTIALNILTTSLIAGRVWWYKRKVRRAFGERELFSSLKTPIEAILNVPGSSSSGSRRCEAH